MLAALHVSSVMCIYFNVIVAWRNNGNTVEGRPMGRGSYSYVAARFSGNDYNLMAVLVVHPDKPGARARIFSAGKHTGR